MLKVNVDASFYAIDIETGEINASTNSEDEEKIAPEIGISMDSLKNKKESFHAKVNGVNSYCVFTIMGSNYIGRVISNKTLYENVPSEMMELAACLVLIALILVAAVTRYMNRQVISGIHDVNDNLRKITKGELDVRVEVQKSTEFVELSNHINEMVQELVDNNQQLEHLLGKAKEERDFDALTGLYNRRGLDQRLEELFQDKDHLGESALIMIDADGLKDLNDSYGHEIGDEYLRCIANLLKEIGCKKSMAARQGGDEFELFLYGYDNEEDLLSDINKIQEFQDTRTVILKNGVEVRIRFSYGHCLKREQKDYQKMFKIADERMYSNKRKRKSS